MRIAIDTHSTQGRKTGIGSYTTNLLHALEHVAPEHEYVPLAWHRSLELRIDQRLRWQQIELPRLARAAGVDLLHVTGFDAPLWKPCPVILTVHDLIGALFPGNLPPISRFYWGRWLPRTIRRADKIVAVSEHTKRDMVHLLNFLPDQIDVVYPGVSEVYRPMGDEVALAQVRQRYQLPHDMILYVGTLEPRKGLDTLISAFGQLASTIHHDLVIAGKKGWYTDPLFRRVKELGLEQRVYFTGYVADEALPMLYNQASLFVFPSRYEGFGLPPLEAMACGVPVVYSDVASLPEVVGEAGLPVPPDDETALAAAILRVLSDETLRETMRVRGLARAATFTWEAAARRMSDIYEAMR
ncbi:MAG: glycosyltransferase family 4 protein [Chloroflexota bacterium]|nr:glycosyltransferase family 4 protein [Chloroflexota bacterium]